MNQEEQNYLDLVQDIIENGEKRTTRNDSITRSLFAKSLSFNLENDTLPLLTTKKVFFRGVVEELLWFLRGQTNSRILEEKGVNIWKGHSSKPHLDSCGLYDYEEGECGPIYGSQWRNWGSSGIDQIKEVVNGIKNDPYSRRHVISAWNVSDLKKMCLPPCHILAQFFVDNDKGLTCQFYQRSCDIGLGVPFNIASYATLTHLIAHLTGCNAKKLVQVMGDAHVYESHVDALREQAKLDPFTFPKLKMKRKMTSVKDLEALIFEDFLLEKYNSHQTIKMKMVV